MCSFMYKMAFNILLMLKNEMIHFLILLSNLGSAHKAPSAQDRYRSVSSFFSGEQFAIKEPNGDVSVL